MSFPAALLRPTFTALPTPPPAPPGPAAPTPATTLITALIEALMGRRPLHQLRPYLERPALEQLSSKVDSGHYRRLTPGRVRTQMPSPDCVEACVRLAIGARSLTCAIRLDRGRSGWRCTDFAVLEPAALAA